ncbi:hypothetical protein [Marinobacter salicampi]|uniref:hypothetical protein n=1 Tax=Marinobacter salicampi TaxID=435907 RepID=UPI00140A29D7|nr:hypothetical protein [Marinobacter salicampi]
MTRRRTLLVLIIGIAPVAIWAVGRPGAAPQTIEQSVEVSSPTGEAMSITRVMKVNPNGSYTLLKLEPADQVTAFYDRACKKLLGLEARYSGPGRHVLFTKEANPGYSCASSEALTAELPR